MMKYEIGQILPLQPIIVRYKEDDEEREDLFFFAPESQTLIPGFSSGEGPKEPQEFIKSFITAFKEILRKAVSPGIIAAKSMPPGMIPPGGQKSGGIIIPK